MSYHRKFGILPDTMMGSFNANKHASHDGLGCFAIQVVGLMKRRGQGRDECGKQTRQDGAHETRHRVAFKHRQDHLETFDFDRGAIFKLFI
jgi:hypothetical protein